MKLVKVQTLKRIGQIGAGLQTPKESLFALLGKSVPSMPSAKIGAFTKFNMFFSAKMKIAFDKKLKNHHVGGRIVSPLMAEDRDNLSVIHVRLRTFNRHGHTSRSSI